MAAGEVLPWQPLPSYRICVIRHTKEGTRPSNRIPRRCHLITVDVHTVSTMQASEGVTWGIRNTREKFSVVPSGGDTWFCAGEISEPWI